MAATNDRIVTVFGGTGFLGRRVVQHLRQREFSVRVASRHLNREHRLSGRDDPQLHAMKADIRNEGSVADAVAGVYAVVNAVSLYVEHGQDTFHAVHVESAERVAIQAQRAGVARLVHISGIGADPLSSSPYIRKRGEGELAVRAAFAGATLIRPAVMFGTDDAFLTTLLGLLRTLPIYPMFGGGRTRLQPVHVEDVAQAVAAVMQRPETPAMTFECGGPRVYSYQELLGTVASAARLKPRLFPVPFAVWHALAGLGELLPRPPVTRNQVELMQVDNVTSPEMPGLAELGISPRSVEEVLQAIVSTR